MSYDKTYSEVSNVFGKDSDKNLIKYSHLIKNDLPVLDIGAGQGRHSFYLAEKGYEVYSIDTSKVGLDHIRKVAKEKELNIETHLGDIQTFDPKCQFSAILIYGLFQILNWDEIRLLIDKLNEWTIEESLVFITAWTVDDPSYDVWKNFDKIGNNSYENKSDEIRTFFEKNEIMNFFPKHEVIHHWEGIGPKHHHGNRILEQHGKVELIVRRKL